MNEPTPTAARDPGPFYHGTKADLTNEPSLNAAWLFNYAGRADKTQQTVRQAVNTLWTTQPDGIPGNDDLGEMSSWFVFAALGLYPQVPSRAELVVGSPLFPFAHIDRAGGRDIVIRAPQAAADTPFVQSLRVDGTPSTQTWLMAPSSATHRWFSTPITA